MLFPVPQCFQFGDKHGIKVVFARRNGYHFHDGLQKCFASTPDNEQFGFQPQTRSFGHTMNGLGQLIGKIGRSAGHFQNVTVKKVQASNSG